MPHLLSPRFDDQREDRRANVAAQLGAGTICLDRLRIPDDATCLEFSGESSLSERKTDRPAWPVRHETTGAASRTQ
jgi:hypothetical protein